MDDISDRIAAYRATAKKRAWQIVGTLWAGAGFGFFLIFLMFAVTGLKTLPGWMGLPMIIALLGPVVAAMRSIHTRRRRALESYGLYCSCCGKLWQEDGDITGRKGQAIYRTNPLTR